MEQATAGKSEAAGLMKDIHFADSYIHYYTTPSGNIYTTSV